MVWVKKVMNMIDIWAFWWKIIYKAQIKLLILITYINILLVSKGTVSPKPHSTLDTAPNSHDLILEKSTALAKRVWYKCSLPQPPVFLIHTSLKIFLIDAQGISFAILISICLTLRWDSLLQNPNFSYLQLDWKGFETAAVTLTVTSPWD